MKLKPERAITPGSGNVFADLGLPNPEQELLKGLPCAADFPHHQRAGDDTEPGCGGARH